MIPLWAGFECGEIEWANGPLEGKRQNFLKQTGHDVNKDKNYKIIKDHGISVIRDGLTINSTIDFEKAVALAKKHKIESYWDLHHYDFPDHLDPFAIDFPKKFCDSMVRVDDNFLVMSNEINKFCIINEPDITAFNCGQHGDWYKNSRNRGLELKCNLVKAYVRTSHYLRFLNPNVNIFYTDPFYGRGTEFESLDMILGRLWPQLGGYESAIDTIGVNYFPHNITDKPLSEVLNEIHDRYEKPLAIGETSWHVGYHEDFRPEWFSWKKADWLKYVIDECHKTRAKVIGICWYPIINSPAWNELPGPIWDHGLILPDGSVDENLSKFIKDYNNI